MKINTGALLRLTALSFVVCALLQAADTNQITILFVSSLLGLFYPEKLLSPVPSKRNQDDE